MSSSGRVRSAPGRREGRPGRGPKCAAPARLAEALVLALATSCTSPHEVALLEVESAAPTMLEPGATLEVRGSGFPSGSAGRLRCQGELHRPGALTRDVEVELALRARSADLASAFITDEVVERFGGRGTFVGRLTVSFPAADGAEVIGTLDTELDLARSTRDALADQRSELESAQRWSSPLGWSLADDESGVFVESVVDGGWAGSHGILPGDRIVRLGGVRIRAQRDLRPVQPEPLLVLRRPGRRSEMSLAAPSLGTSPLARFDPLGAVLLVSILVLAIALGPLASFVDPRRLVASWRRRSPAQRLLAVTMLPVAALASALVSPPVLMAAATVIRPFEGPRGLLRLTPIALCAGWAAWCGFEGLAVEMGAWCLVVSALARPEREPGRKSLLLVTSAAEAALLAVLLYGAEPVAALAAPCLLFLGGLLPSAGSWSRALALVGCAAAVLSNVVVNVPIRVSEPLLPPAVLATLVLCAMLVSWARPPAGGERLHLFL